MAHFWLDRPTPRVDRDWFARYQVELVAFANTAWGRRYLRLDAEPVTGVWHSAIHYRLGERERRAVFWSRPLVARRLQRYAESVQRWGELGARVRLDSASREAHAFAAAATRTFQPDANPETTSVDGSVQWSGSPQTFASIRAAPGTFAQDSNTTFSGAVFLNSLAGNPANRFTVMSRVIVLFDTSTLGAAALLQSATFRSNTQSSANSYGSQGLMTTNTASPASNTALTQFDYDPALFGTADLAARKDFAGGIPNGYNDYALNGTGMGIIAKTGITKFGQRQSWDADNSAPVWVDGAQAGIIGNYSFAGSASPPQLVVNYFEGNAILLLCDV